MNLDRIRERLDEMAHINHYCLGEHRPDMLDTHIIYVLRLLVEAVEELTKCKGK